MMDDRLAKAEVLFHDALEMAPQRRDAFLQGACGQDGELRQEVMALLRASGVADDWLKEPVEAETGLTGASEGPGTVIGRYKLLEKIGEGGFGAVYLAEQERPVRRRVALKIIKLGMDTHSVIARFDAERQALALMNHPRIAKVLDGGATDTGRPYFVMDLVRGVPITTFCEAQQLNTADRLGLFIEVCGAIEHAHQKGIIHRDIKPSNVLVTLNEGVAHPMVIDFGVAKALNQRLTEHTVFTQYAQMIGTPAYMSPEQAEMSKLDVDTRSDVYSLGVLLYELLTGTTPFPDERLRTSGYAEMQRIICEEQPLKPSTRLKKRVLAGAGAAPRPSLLASDLDWIVMKCLEKDRGRRYATVSGLAADLRRLLSDEPIVARPPSRLYRLQKLVRRNKLAVGAGAGVIVVLLLATVVSAWQALRAEQKADESRRSAYAADMILTQAALEAGNIGRAKELLSKHVPRSGETDLRGWEWRYAWNQCHSDEVFALRGHSMNVTTLALWPGRGVLASGSLDGTVKLWDWATQKTIRTVPQSDGVYGLAFSPDGKELFVGTKDGQVAIWDCETWQRVTTLRDLSWIRSVAVSPDGKRLAAFGTEVLTLWERPTRKRTAGIELMHSLDLAPGGIAFSPDSSLLAYSRGDGVIVLADPASGRTLDELHGHTAYTSVLAFSPTGSVLVSGSRDHTVRVWDVALRQERKRLDDFAGWVGSLAFSPDGQFLAIAGSGQRVHLLETRSWRELNAFRGHSAEVWAAVFAPVGNTLLTGAKDLSIKAWAVSTNQQPRSFRLPAGLRSAMFLSEPSFLYVVYTNTMCGLWSTEAFQELERRPLPLPDSTFSRLSKDRKHWLAVDRAGDIKVYDLAKDGVVATLPGPFASDYRPAIAYSADGQALAAVGADHICHVWRMGDFQEVAAFAISARTLSALKFLGNDRLLAVGSWAGETEIWQIASTNKLASLHGHTWSIQDFALTRDGSTLLSCSGDGRIMLWRMPAGTLIATLKGHLNTCFALALSPDESRIASCSGDGTVKLWDAKTKQEVASFKFQNQVRQLAFSADNSLLLLADEAPQQMRLFVLRAPAVE